MRAMRTIPMYVTIAEAIRDYSPNAWVINYTNPMTLCVRTLYMCSPRSSVRLLPRSVRHPDAADHILDENWA